MKFSARAEFNTQVSNSKIQQRFELRFPLLITRRKYTSYAPEISTHWKEDLTGQIKEIKETVNKLEHELQLVNETH